MKRTAITNQTKYRYTRLNVVLAKEKAAGCSEWRTKMVYTLKPTDLAATIAEREYSLTEANDNEKTFSINRLESLGRPLLCWLCIICAPVWTRLWPWKYAQRRAC